MYLCILYVCVPQIRDQVDYGNDDVANYFSRLEICVRTEEDTYDTYVNDLVTVYV